MRRLPLAATAVALALALVAMVDWPVTDVDFARRLAAPSTAHPLGTDQLGRDVLARVLGGVRYSVGLGAAALALAAVTGVAAGLVSGRLEDTRWRVAARAAQSAVDVLAALPALLVGLLVAAVAGPGLPSALLAVALSGWAPFARQTHRLTLAVHGEGWVTAATALGAGPTRVLVHHVLPAIAGPLLAVLPARFVGAVVTLAGLSFLGLGVQPPTPEWGAMLAEGRTYAFVAPWLVAAPAAALVATTLGLAWVLRPSAS